MMESSAALQLLLDGHRIIPELSGRKTEEIFCNPLFVKRYQDFVDPWNPKFSKADGEVMPLFLAGALKSDRHPPIESGGAAVQLRAGADIRFLKPVTAGERYRVLYRAPVLTEVQAAAAGEREYLYTDVNAVLYDAAGEPVMDVLMVSRVILRHEGNIPAEGFEKHVYTQEEKTWMQSVMDGETIRGAEPRYIENVQSGEKLPPATYGPMTPLDMIFYSGARYSLRSYPLRRLRELTPELVVRNEENNAFKIWNSYNFTDDAAAGRLTGVPAAFQIPEFAADAMMRLVTNWMGDGAFVERLRWRHICNTPLYDCAVADGSVKGKAAESTVLVEASLENTCRGCTDDEAQLWVRLPSRP